MVYVDAAIWPLGKMMMCHLMADSLEELHAMATSLGVRRWFQDKPGRMPHYDLCKSKRARAVQLGAEQVTRERVVEIMNAWRKNQGGQSPRKQIAVEPPLPGLG